MKALVIGAGISGLTAALSLQAASIEVEVFDAVERILPLGLGVNLQPYATRELYDLGLAPLLQQRGVANTSLRYFNKFGQEVWVDPIGSNAGYNWPQVALYRGALQDTMLAELLRRIGRDNVHPGHRFVSFEENQRGIEACFALPNGERKMHTADFIIGADGVKSAVRRAMFGMYAEPTFSGLTLWRAAVSHPPILDARSMFVAGNYSQRLVCYPISDTGEQPGEQTLNWVGVLDEGDIDIPPEEWNAAGNRTHFLSQFESWKFDWLDVPALLDRAPKILRFPMVDRDPLDEWSCQGAVLIGDAAHPIYPVGSNGASHAILDARVLVHALANARDLQDAFKTYEGIRIPMLRRTLEANRLGGPDRILSEADQMAPQGFTDLDQQFPIEQRRSILDSYRRVAGFPADALNAHPGYSVSAKTP